RHRAHDGDRAGAGAGESVGPPDLVRLQTVGTRWPAGARALARGRAAVRRHRALPQRHPARAHHGPADVRVDDDWPSLARRLDLPARPLRQEGALDFLMSSMGGSAPCRGTSSTVVIWFMRLTMSRI